MEQFEALAAEVDKNKTKFIQRLRDAVEIPSVSSDISYRAEISKMIDWTQQQMEKLSINCTQIENEHQIMHDGCVAQLPSVLIGSLGNDINKKTLLIYGHLDVQPAHINDGWNTDPFKLIEKDEKLFGRGSTDDKGPVVAWLNAIEVMQTLNVDIPVNIKFLFESMEESGSLGLDKIIAKNKNSFFSNVDLICISDNYWLGKNKPCITFGLRGIIYFFVEVKGPKQDLHSGLYGGTIYEPMNDLIWLLSQLTDVNNKILIDNIYDSVKPLNENELNLYKKIDFDVNDYKTNINVNKLVTENKEEILMNRWRFPSLSIHGIEGAFYGLGEKTVIPSKVVGKFSIRLVPDMEPEKIFSLVNQYLIKLWSQRNSPNEFSLYSSQSGKPWVSDFNHPNYQAGARALKKVFNVEPDFTREGGSIPITLTLQEQLQKNIMLLPIGACDDMAHSQNEKINISNYINGIKTFIAYLIELKDV